MKLPFGEVKKDIHAKYNYREYESFWNKKPVKVIYDGHNEEVIYDFTRWNENDPVADFRLFRLSVNEFMQISYKEITEMAYYTIFS